MSDDLTQSVLAGFAELFVDADSFLGPVGVKQVGRVLKKGNLRGQHATEDLCDLPVLADLAGRPDVLLACAELLRPVPFTGDVNFYEPLRQVQCAALRRTEVDGGDTERHRELILLPENGKRDQNTKSRAAALTYKRMQDQTATNEKTGAYGLGVYCHLIRELHLMWAFGGSFRWKRSRIDGEIARLVGLLREIRALPFEG